MSGLLVRSAKVEDLVLCGFGLGEYGVMTSVGLCMEPEKETELELSRRLEKSNTNHPSTISTIVLFSKCLNSFQKQLLASPAELDHLPLFSPHPHASCLPSHPITSVRVIPKLRLSVCISPRPAFFEFHLLAPQLLHTRHQHSFLCPTCSPAPSSRHNADLEMTASSDLVLMLQHASIE